MQVFRLGAVDVAGDIQVVIVFRIADLGQGDHAVVLRHLGKACEGIDNPVNVLVAQAILVAVLDKTLRRIDHENALAGAGVFLVEDDDAGRDAGAVEEVRRQADDPLL